jgi:hypothetical protein
LEAKWETPGKTMLKTLNWQLVERRIGFKFIYKIEARKVVFLGRERREDRQIVTKWYRKPLASDTLLNYRSQHTLQQKPGDREAIENPVKLNIL